MRTYYTIVTEELYDIVQGLLTLNGSCVPNDKNVASNVTFQLCLSRIWLTAQDLKNC